jgi:hypothetical protein
VKDEAASGLDGAADVHLPLEDVVRDSFLGAIGNDAEAFQQIGEADVVCAVIDDETHGSVIGMGAHIDYRPCEAAIRHQRHCDKKLSFETAFAALSPLCPRRTHEERVSPEACACEAEKSKLFQRFVVLKYVRVPI